MKKLTLTLTAAVVLLAGTVLAQPVGPVSWGLTYTNFTAGALTNTVAQATVDFNTLNGKTVLLMASCYSTNSTTGGATGVGSGTCSFVFVPSPDGVTFYSDDFNTNNQRLSLSLVTTNTVYAWKVFDPGPWRYWGLRSFEKPSTNALVTNIVLQILRTR